MIQLKNLELPPKLVMFTDLRANVAYALKARILSMANYSGYPQASNVTGRLQRQFDFSTMEQVLVHFVKNRNLVKFAGDVLNLIPIANMQKYQMSRADVGAFITNHAAAHGMHELTVEEKDFVSYLMTSSESMASNWMLEFSDSEDNNLHLQFSRLYKELLDTLGTDSTSAVFCYSADGDKVTSLLDSPKGALLGNDYTDRVRKAKPGEKVDNSELVHMITVEVLSNMRILDHLHALFMSQEPWHIFISPRTNEGTGLNITRAQSLQLMAGYLHSLLLYPYHLKAEMFLGLYEKIQTWLIPLPAMPAHLKEHYDSTIRHTDVLGAGEDARAVLSANDFENEVVINSTISNFYREQIAILGLTKIDEKATTAASKVTGFSLNDLKTLGEPQYQGILLAQPVIQLTIVPSVTQALMVADVMDKFVMNCCSAIAGLSSRFHVPLVLDKLKSLAFRVSVTFLPKINPVANPKKVSENVMIGGDLKLSSHLPGSTRSYDLHIQRSLINTVFTPGTAISNFKSLFIVNENTRQMLEKQVPRFTQTLLPESIHPGFKSISREGVSRSLETRKSLFEDLTGMSYPLFTRAVVSDLFVKDLATVMSSFCLVFETPGQVGVGNIYKLEVNGAGQDGGSYSLINGYGHPYGLDYQGLMNYQDDIKPEQYLPIAPGIAIVLLVKIPTISFDLKIDPDFINLHPYSYFSANGEGGTVGDFVYAKPLTNFSFMPVPISEPILAKFFLDRNYVFVNQQVYIEVNLDQIAVVESNTDGFKAPFNVRDWSGEKYNYFAQYITPGTYGPAGVATSINATETTASLEAKRVSDMVKAAEAKMIEMDENKPTQKIVDASPAMIKESDIKDLGEVIGTSKKEEPKKESPAPKIEPKVEVAPEIEIIGKKKKDEDDEDTEDDADKK